MRRSCAERCLGLGVLLAMASGFGPSSAEGGRGFELTGEALGVEALPVSGDTVADGESGRAWDWELDLAYGFGVDMSSAATYLGDVRFVGAAPRVGRAVGGDFQAGEWYEGRVHLLVEIPMFVSLEPERGYAVGATVLSRYTFSLPTRLRPFVELGAGPVYLDFNNDRSQADGFSFTLQGGPGVMVSVTPAWALVLRAQLHHISNAGLRRPNPGINDLLFSVGVARQAR